MFLRGAKSAVGACVPRCGGGAARITTDGEAASHLSRDQVTVHSVSRLPIPLTSSSILSSTGLRHSCRRPWQRR